MTAGRSRDLTADDFELRVDGKPRTIVSAQFVAVLGGRDRGAARAGGVVRQPPIRSNDAAAGGRLIMIVVDRGSIVGGTRQGAMEAASRFVQQLNPADRVALATIPHGPQVAFTADHALVERQIQQIDGTALSASGSGTWASPTPWRSSGKTIRHAEGLNERECGNADVGVGGRGGGQSEVLICIERGALRGDRPSPRTRGSGRAIRSRAANAGRKPAAKLDAQDDGVRLRGAGRRPRASQLKWLEARAAASHVTIYALHLERSTTDAAQARPMPGRRADRVLQEEGLQLLAQATRGDVFRVMSNSDFAFQRLSLELSGYYLLGFEPEAGDRNGRPHDIQVDVGANGVTVRSRRQFTIDADRR